MSTGETWVLNETVDTSVNNRYYTNFTTVGTTNTNWISLETNLKFSVLLYYPEGGDGDEVYSDMAGGWTNQAYRTITFSTPPTGDLLTWLQANGTKQ